MYSNTNEPTMTETTWALAEKLNINYAWPWELRALCNDISEVSHVNFEGVIPPSDIVLTREETFSILSAASEDIVLWDFPKPEPLYAYEKRISIRSNSSHVTLFFEDLTEDEVTVKVVLDILEEFANAYCYELGIGIYSNL